MTMIYGFMFGAAWDSLPLSDPSVMTSVLALKALIIRVQIIPVLATGKPLL